MLGAKIAFKVLKRFYIQFLVFFFCKMASLAAGTKRGHSKKMLKVKYDALIQFERGMSNKGVARNFNAAKNTLSTWKKNKEKIIAAFKSSGGTKRQRINKGRYKDVNVACYRWLLIQGSANIPINGQILKEKALDVAKQLDIETFQASDGWLRAWKARYSISFREISGESNSVTPEMIESWKGASLPTILSRFQLKTF